MAESAVAVEREMVGKESDAVLIGGDVEFRKACSCARLAASSAAAAVCASAFDLGVAEKNWAILLAFACVDLTNAPPLSLCGERDGQGVGGEVPRREVDIDIRRAIARCRAGRI